MSSRPVSPKIPMNDGSPPRTSRRELQWIASCATRPSRHVVPATSRLGRASGVDRRYAAVLGALVVSLMARGARFARDPVARLFVNPPPGTTFVSRPLTSATVATPQFADISGRPLSRIYCRLSMNLAPTLWLRSVGRSFDARPLPGTDGAREPFWSPDNEWIGFFDRSPHHETHPGFGRDCPDDRGRHHRSTWRLMGPGRRDRVWDRVWRLFTSFAAGGEPPTDAQLDSIRKGRGFASLAAIPSRRTAFSIHREKRPPRQRGAYAASRDGTIQAPVHPNGRRRAVRRAEHSVLFLDGDTLLNQALDRAASIDRRWPLRLQRTSLARAAA